MSEVPLQVRKQQFLELLDSPDTRPDLPELVQVAATTLHPEPCTLHPEPCTLRPAP